MSGHRHKDFLNRDRYLIVCMCYDIQYCSHGHRHGKFRIPVQLSGLHNRVKCTKLTKYMNGLPETGCAADMVWYGAYGSNLQFQRFKYYIIGGKPPGAYKKHHPMQDKTLPTLDLRFIMRRRVYFAERSLVWNGGVAFISAEESPEEKALCRIYLIKRLQFVELFAQENHIQMSEVNIDFDKLSLEKRVISGKGRYRLILHVGEKRGHPIYTFTRPRESQSEFIPPSEKYLETMINGLIECWSTKKKSELIEYLYSVTRGTYNRNKLAYLFDMRQKK